MKKINRRDVIRLSAGAVIYMYTPKILTGCGKADEKIIGPEDASINSVKASDSCIWLPNADGDVLVLGEEAFRKAAQALDTLPNGFPTTPEGLEIDLLKIVFTEEEADLFSDLRLTLETVEQIAERTGRSIDGLEVQLIALCEKELITGIAIGGVSLYRIKPWVVGVYESMMDRMDRDFLQLAEKYMVYFGKQLYATKPQIMRVVPISETIPDPQQALPYHRVSSIIEAGVQFRVNDCFCKRRQEVSGQPCDKPVEVCMAIINAPNVELVEPWGREISKQEAYQILDQAEEAALVHLTANQQSDNYYICNCCGCCCGVLSGINLMGEAHFVVNSAYLAAIDPLLCESCGKCKNERCQVAAIEEGDDCYRVNEKRCIGCGLCVTTCPSGAAHLLLKPESEITPPPADATAWNDQRAQNRGVDYSKYK